METKTKIVYVDAVTRHLVGLPKDSTFIESLDYFISVFDKSCKFKKKFKGVEIEFTCPKYAVCDKSNCLVSEELRTIKQKIDK